MEGPQNRPKMFHSGAIRDRQNLSPRFRHGIMQGYGPAAGASKSWPALADWVPAELSPFPCEAAFHKLFLGVWFCSRSQWQVRSRVALVGGGGGFIGGHLIAKLRELGYDQIRSVDIKPIDEWYQVHDDVENISGRPEAERRVHGRRLAA